MSKKTYIAIRVIAVVTILVVGANLLLKSSEVVSVAQDPIQAQLSRLEAVSKEMQKANEVLEVAKAEHKEAVDVFIQLMVDYEAVKGDVLYNIQANIGYYE